MSASTVRILIAIFLIAHGLMYAGLTNVPMPEPGGLKTPFMPAWWRANVDNNWLAVRLGLPEGFVPIAGSVLWLAATVGFVLAGLGIFGLPGLSAIWPVLATVAAGVSVVLLAFYWHSWYVVGAAINVAVLMAVWQSWPALLFATK